MKFDGIEIDENIWEEVLDCENWDKYPNDMIQEIYDKDKGDFRYFRRKPVKETYPKFFGSFEVDDEGDILARDFNDYITLNEIDIENLELAIAEAKKIIQIKTQEVKK